MKVLNDYRCHACNNVSERFIDASIFEIPCECGGISRKIIGMPRIELEGISGDFPGAHAKWANIREQNLKVKRKKSYFGE